MSYNRWSYVEANPVNRIDPSGFYSRELIDKNIPLMDFSSKPGDQKSHSHWGFYALLLNAKDYDWIKVGYADLRRQYPDIWWVHEYPIRQINCDRIMIGSHFLNEFYDGFVKSQNDPGIWWRDTSATYYEIAAFDYVTGKPLIGKGYADGDIESSYPLYHSLSFGIGINEVNLIADVDGNMYLSFGIPSLSQGKVAGVGYTESYVCNLFAPCTADLPRDQVEQAIAGICGSAEIILFRGVSGSMCHGSALDLNFSTVSTFYTGIEGGGGGGLTLTFPLPWSNSRRGWRWALDFQRNGITFMDTLRMGN